MRGIHLASLDEAVFIRGHVQFERLLSWSNRMTFDLEIMTKSDDSSFREEKVSRHKEPPMIATYKGTTLGLRVRSTEFWIKPKRVANRRFMQSEEWAVLDFDVAEPI